jgi:hypothetical protein
MTRVGFGGRSVAVAGILIVGASLAACGDDTRSSVATPSNVSPINRPVAEPGPQINGAPVAIVMAGQPYHFQPQVSSQTTGTALSFSVTNPPAWTKFDSSTGALSGTPTAGQVGQYSGITIAASDGAKVTTLPPFTITVTDGNSSDTVTLSWVSPTENADGTPLVDLKGFKVHYGSASQSYSDVVDVANAGLTTYVVQNLPAGKYYFAVTAYNSTGQESSFSPEIETQIN